MQSSCVFEASTAVTVESIPPEASTTARALAARNVSPEHLVLLQVEAGVEPALQEPPGQVGGRAALPYRREEELGSGSLPHPALLQPGERPVEVPAVGDHELELVLRGELGLDAGEVPGDH